MEINAEHITKANIIFPELLKMLSAALRESGRNKAAITVCGGSGVGKSEIASLLTYYFSQAGILSYTLSGDNYPHRIPRYNDAERLRIFRNSAIQGMVREGQFSPERFAIVRQYQQEGVDADPVHATVHPWYQSYLRNGRKGLQGYLGSADEIGFAEVESIVNDFKNGADEIWLKRMGREDTEMWYEKVDFSNIRILVIEWTHGNSDHYQGVDIPILLNSTPAETLAHRRARNRDGATDSPFTTMVLALEQEMLAASAYKAKMILSKEGELFNGK